MPKNRPAKRGYRLYKHDTARPTMIKEVDIDTGKRERIPWRAYHHHALMWCEHLDAWEAAKES